MALPATFVKNFHDEQCVRKMEYLPFGTTGLNVSKVSLGGGTFSHFYGDVDETTAIKTIHSAVKRGINYLDTAPFYGQGKSEEIYGKALKNIPREAYYIATKVGRYELEYGNMFDYTATKTRASVERSLKLLGLKCIDVVQIHDIEFAPNLDIIYKETLPMLELLKKEGKIRFIGVTGYPLEMIKQTILGAPNRFDTVLCYARNTMFDDTLKNYLPFFMQHNLGIICASGHALGLLTNTGPQSWHPCHEETKQVCREAAKYCQQHGVELGKLAMHHFIQMKGPCTFLVGMENEKLLDLNLNVYYTGLDKNEQEVYKYLIKNIFNKIANKHWEGLELERYRAAMKLKQ